MSPVRRARALVAIAVSSAIVLVLGLFLAATPVQAQTPVANTHAKATASTSAGSTKSGLTGKSRYVPAPCTNAAAAAPLAKAKTKPDRLASCFAYGKAGSNGKVVTSQDTPPTTATTPAQIQDAYDLPDSGEGMTVAIVDAFGYANAEADLQVFRDYYGLPACTTANGCFTKIDQRGGTDYPAEDPGWSIETALDVDAVSSACPKCHILLVQGDDNSLDNLGAGVVTAASWPGVVAISNSYGVDGEGSDEVDYDPLYDHPGIAVTVSTGDYGWGPSWPATGSKVVAVGGTSLTADSSTSRGWSESAWDGAGSGCSAYETKPDWQAGVETGCDNRAEADISADADPESGIALYNTLGESGWAQYGGTSLSSPLVASMYALAGTPTPGSYPASYPWTDAARDSHINDITTGTNGSCGAPMCDAGTGWDGPTGWGTPHGVGGLTQGPHGTVTGTVTSGGSGLAGATITATDADDQKITATSSSSGAYSLTLPVGTYSVSVTKFGYSTKSVDGVAVDEGGTVTEDFDIATVPSHTVSGTVTDGGGHGWPMYAKVSVDGAPGAVYTNPTTGKYSLSLPEGSDYSVHVTSAALSGYDAYNATVHVGTANQKVDVALPVSDSCVAAGYSVHYDSGFGTTFDGWTGATPQDGWTVTSAISDADTWRFDDPGNRGNSTGGTGTFAIVDSDHAGSGKSQDTTLVSPVADMSDIDHAVLDFKSQYRGYSNSTADVDLSTDGGATWTNVWRETTDTVTGPEEVSLPGAAGSSQVQVRFHFTGSYAWWWGIDDISIGNKSCDPVDGALVTGTVADDNTGDGLNGAKVSVDNNTAEGAVTRATPDDAALADGFYEAYVASTDLNAAGKVALTVTDGKYAAASAKVAVVAEDVTRKNWRLAAGHLTVSTGSVAVTEQLGVAKSKTVTFGNDGTLPVHVDLGEQGSSFGPMAGSSAAGAPAAKVKADAFVGDHAAKAAKDAKAGKSATSGADATPSGSGLTSADAWTPVADLPETLADEAAVTVDGKVYSFGGWNGSSDIKKTYVYDPDAGSWGQVADMPETLEAARAVTVDGLIYVVGGWNSNQQENTNVYIYDPGADSWSTGAEAPAGVAAPGVAVVGGKIYVVGGCTDAFNCAPANPATMIYDPAGDSWSTGADYPESVAFASCGGLGAEVFCAGGTDAASGSDLTTSYSYDPASDSWSQKASMPAGQWGSAVANAGGRLQIAQGLSGGNLVNSAVEYDPATDAWSPLPNANTVSFRGAGACGMYSLGGQNETGFAKTVQELPGYDSCGSATDVAWLSEDPASFDVAPGASVTVTVTMDSTVVDQPGTYTSGVSIATDSPYRATPVTTTMTVNPPASWAKITGTVKSSTGTPIKGATVQICTMYIAKTGLCGPVTYTLTTDADGKYQLWLAQGYSPLSVIAAKDGYQPKMAIAKLTKGATTTTNFSLAKS